MDSKRSSPWFPTVRTQKKHMKKIICQKLTFIQRKNQITRLLETLHQITLHKSLVKGHWCPQGVGPWPPLVGSESVIAGPNLSVPCLSSSRGFSIAEMEGTYLSGARVAEANYGGIFSTLKQPNLLYGWPTIINLQKEYLALCQQHQCR